MQKSNLTFPKREATINDLVRFCEWAGLVIEVSPDCAKFTLKEKKAKAKAKAKKAPRKR